MDHYFCSDITALARAAVSGDEHALEMFSMSRSSKGANRATVPMIGQQEATTFFIGGKLGMNCICLIFFFIITAD